MIVSHMTSEWATIDFYMSYAHKRVSMAVIGKEFKANWAYRKFVFPNTLEMYELWVFQEGFSVYAQEQTWITLLSCN